MSEEQPNRRREVARQEALEIYLAGAKHGDAGAHRDEDIDYWRSVELAFDKFWRTTTRGALKRAGRERNRGRR